MVPSTPSSSSPSGWVAPSPGELDAVLTQYDVTALLGRGGMGAVYRALQTNLDREVAIKILPLELAVDEEGMQFAERFRQEAKSMAKLSHPAIIQVFDFGEAESTTGGEFLYFVMEFVEGMDILEYLKEHGGRLEPSYAHAIICHVLDALAFAHGNGIIHRDIKPANIMLDQHGRVKVADFGLAKSTTQDIGLTMTNVAMGTPDFIAPETFEIGRALDGRADLYAVGVMLYQLLTGGVPRGMFRSATQQVAQLDPRYDAIIEKALQAEPEDRYASAADFRADMDRIVTEPVPVASAKTGQEALNIGGRKNLKLKTNPNLAHQPGRRPVFGKGPQTPAAEAPATEKKKVSPMLWVAAGVLVPVLIIVGVIMAGKGNNNENPTVATANNPVTEVTPKSGPPGGTAKEKGGKATTGGGGAVKPPAPAGEKVAGEEIENSLGMKLCWIPPGKFTMGSPESEVGRNPVEEAQVDVELTRGFWMGKYEVTQGKWEAVMGTSVRDLEAMQTGKHEKHKGIHGEGEDHPMYHVSWENAVAFCAKLTESEQQKGKLPGGWGYRLPTEAQWEYACRAGDQGSYSGAELDELGWYQGNSGGKTHEVGQKKANAWGLHDMHGNVWEWCADWYVDKPHGGKDPVGHPSGTRRVFRGGGWIGTAADSRSAHRSWSPSEKRGSVLGFRVCLSSTTGGLP